MIDPKFLEILRCPQHTDSGPLQLRGSFLVCPVCGCGYPVVQGIPQLLPEDAVPPEELPND